MAPVAMIIGALLIALGIGAYAYDRTSVTALIPAFFGAVFVILGWLARNESMRKHVMHLAAGLALVGAIMAGYRAVPGLMKAGSGEAIDKPLALFSTTTMTLLCAVFIILCIRSFVAARRARSVSDRGIE